MPLTEEEKEALRKKYREQRQAIWTGKPSSRLPSQDASEVEEIEVSRMVSFQILEIPSRSDVTDQRDRCGTTFHDISVELAESFVVETDLLA